MRNLRCLLTFTFVLLIIAGNLFSQAVGGRVEVYEKTHIPKKEPVPYKFTREADVYWSKTIWRVIDLKEKMNLPLYYPTEDLARPNLVKLLAESIKTEGIKVYNPTDKIEFTTELSQTDVMTNLGAGADSTPIGDQGKYKYFNDPADYSHVVQLWVKELWFFNKQYSNMEVRIVGMQPVRVYQKADDTTGTPRKQPIFWVYYPDVRRILSQNFVYNTKNDAQNISFDDLFTQRRFSSYIIKESNVYNDRFISDYTEGMDVLYEAEKIKESIVNWEHDLWEY